MSEDGTMARLPELINFAKQHSLKIGSVEDLIKYRLKFLSYSTSGKSIKFFERFRRGVSVKKIFLVTQ